MEELNVKVGDKVIRQARWGSDICEVVKVTPKGYIEIKRGSSTERFNKYGDRVKQEKYDYIHIRILEDGDIEKIAQEREFEHKRSYLCNYSYQKLPLEALRELVDVIGKYEKK